MNSCRGKSRIMLFHGSFISDGADSYCMVPKTKGASGHMHLISKKHLMEELRRLSLRRRSWVQKALARGKRTRRRVLLKNMPQCCHSSCHERERCAAEIVLVGAEAQDLDNGALIAAKSVDFESY
ncbi:hypothetical protein C4D60_Mb09t18810 [Musa balbisiana]|uniref:Uncharacterized protein n=1 Tax=Musa balbisiana TaxID=52838 RepID=A0A4S8IHI2_MUSBA|nr:hypothetical protein C4D60_Mb09t18810 [Musa balbisiana]